jgi:hypothetical protein
MAGEIESPPEDRQVHAEAPRRSSAAEIAGITAGHVRGIGRAGGRPQRYGTQFVPDGVRHRLWDVEPGTTDEERAAWDVPPLAEQLRRADELTRSGPQPPMDEAPAWLKVATERWTSEGGKEP